jgi:hypothetical protein
VCESAFAFSHLRSRLDTIECVACGWQAKQARDQAAERVPVWLSTADKMAQDQAVADAEANRSVSARSLSPTAQT